MDITRDIRVALCPSNKFTRMSHFSLKRKTYGTYGRTDSGGKSFVPRRGKTSECAIESLIYKIVMTQYTTGI